MQVEAWQPRPNLETFRSETETAKPCVILADHLRQHITRFFLVLKYKTPSREKIFNGAYRKIIEIQKKQLKAWLKSVESTA